jgi:hypothetical protein
MNALNRKKNSELEKYEIAFFTSVFVTILTPGGETLGNRTLSK